MKKSINKIRVDFQLKGIELLDISLKHPQIPLKKERKYSFNINIEQRIIHEEKMVAVISSIEVIHDEDKQCHAAIKTSCVYLIENFEDFFTEKDLLVLPDQFIITLNSISLSTTRGIIYSHFKGTFLNDLVFPIVDPSALSKNE